MSRIEIGVVSRPHGVRGELRVHLHNSDSTAFDVVDGVFVHGTRYELASARLVKGAVLVRLEGVDDRNQAEAMVGAGVEVLRDELELEEDDVLLDDLLGCNLLLEDGSSWGTVAEVITGAQDRLVVHDGEVERHLPLVDAFVLDIDVDNKKIVVAPPEELPEWER
jgi:16S rRNA processing protein RimM